jgi:hypothetical protein
VAGLCILHYKVVSTFIFASLLKSACAEYYAGQRPINVTIAGFLSPRMHPLLVGRG